MQHYQYVLLQHNSLAIYWLHVISITKEAASTDHLEYGIIACRKRKQQAIKNGKIPLVGLSFWQLTPTISRDLSTFASLI